MHRGGAQGRENLYAADNLESELQRRCFEAVDLLSALAKQDGSEIDLAMRLSPEFDLKSELLSGRVRVLTKTDCAGWRDYRAGKHKSCFYNYHRGNLSGIIKIWSSRDRSRIGVYALLKSPSDLLGNLMEMGLAAPSGGGFPPNLGNGPSAVLPVIGAIGKSNSRNTLLKPRRTVSDIC